MLAMLSLVLVAPSGEIASASRSELYRVIDETLRAETDLTLKPFDAVEEIEHCQGAIGCITLAVEAAHRGTGLLVFLSIKRSADGTDRMSAILVDVGAVLAEHATAKSEDFENAVFERAVRARAGPVVMRGVQEARALFLHEFRPTFEATGHWRSGLRRDAPPERVSIPPPTEEPPPARTLLYAGATVLAAGGVTLASGLVVSSSSDTQRICAGAALDQCSDPQLAKIPGTRFSLVSLGYSIALMGGTWIAASLADETIERSPWLWLAIGVAVGAASFAVSTIADADQIDRDH